MPTLLFLCYVQKFLKKFMKKSKKRLDIHGCVYYNRQGVWRGSLCALCDDAGDCVMNGNFCGVCPVIGRLRRECMWRISLQHGIGRHKSAVFHASGVIRTVKRTRKRLDRTQKDKRKKLSTFQGGNN